LIIRQLYPVENQDPLTAARSLLQDLWQSVDLEGMYIPLQREGAISPHGTFLQRPAQLEMADPFAPVMPVNYAPAALKVLQEHPNIRIGIFLRPCEWRSFRVLLNGSGEPFSNLYAISADCTGAMPVEDFELLSEGDPQQVTRQVLHFAAQGGILPSRQQLGCQLCEDPFPIDVDLHFELFGVPTDEQLMLNFRDAEAARALSLQSLATNVPDSLLERREQVLQDLARWRANSFEKRKSELGPDLISLHGLAAHLRKCGSCRATLKAHCPLIDFDLLRESTNAGLQSFRTWLGSCSGCGVCDKTCPDGYPLFGVIFALRQLH
jgi:Pyruvate/2-oxoacid:ferredoxin oxidoreductase delta subunit